MEYSVSITYKDLFEDYSTVNIKDLISDIPTCNAIPLITYFLAQIHLIEPDKTLQIELIQFWAQRFPNEVKVKINQFIGETIKKKNIEFTFISNLSGLLFIESLLENHNNLQESENLSPEQELNFFKAYLLSTQAWIDKQGKLWYNIKPFEDDIDFVKYYLPSHIAYDEFHTVKDFRTQFIKAKYFFEFCERNDEFSSYLEIFLKEYGLDSWNTYLKNILSLYIRKFEILKTPSVINIEDQHIDQLNFLNQLSINLENFTKSDDFLQIRERPIFKLNENNFAFLNLNFLVDKIYQGIQFDFARVLVKNSATYKGKEIKSRVQFLSIFGDEFPETELFYRIMEYSFEKSNYKLFEGEVIKTFIKEGEPDYYIRDKAKVYLFEFKNVFLSGNTKHTLDYENIKSSIYEKLVENIQGHDKGIKQLANVIDKIKENGFNSFDSVKFNESIIYPIIIFTDYSFNTAGVNYLLNKEFRKTLEDRKVKPLNNIKNLIMIDLDDFIKHQDLFRDKKIKLNNILNEYLEHVKGYKGFSNKFTPFEIYIDNKTKSLESSLSKNTIEQIATTIGLK